MRTERDALGTLQLPEDAYYGIQSARARVNFPISGQQLPATMVTAVAHIKAANAVAMTAAGLLDPRLAEAIAAAAGELAEGRFRDAFIVDAFQAGAGTSFHMNANEVLANRANELLDQPRGSYSPVHPNDHVNMGQSTNDVFPTAMRLATLLALPELDEALRGLSSALSGRAGAFAAVIKAGRTHLQDAVPITLGQEFAAYAHTVEHARTHVRMSAARLHTLGLGGSAVGTGLNTPAGHAEAVVAELARRTHLPLVPAPDPFEAMQSLAPFAQLSGALRSLALELIRIANDFRLLSSGPRTGLGELLLPAVQPGSSIMPGKVNPSMAEMLDQVCFQVVGQDATIAMAVQAGQLELNVMMPVVAYNLLNAIPWLAHAVTAFTDRCVAGVTADAERCQAYAHASPALGTALAPLVGYQAAAELVKRSVATGRSIPDLAIEQGLLDPATAARVFDPATLTTPGTLANKNGPVPQDRSA